jgi:hypothetical protein
MSFERQFQDGVNAAVRQWLDDHTSALIAAIAQAIAAEQPDKDDGVDFLQWKQRIQQLEENNT